MGEIIVRNTLSWLELLINRYCCIWLVVYITRSSKHQTLSSARHIENSSQFYTISFHKKMLRRFILCPPVFQVIFFPSTVIIKILCTHIPCQSIDMYTIDIRRPSISVLQQWCGTFIITTFALLTNGFIIPTATSITKKAFHLRWTRVFLFNYLYNILKNLMNKLLFPSTILNLCSSVNIGLSLSFL